MTENFRHHRASREIIFVEVPCGGSPEPLRRGRPPRYPLSQREPWRPQRAIPAKGKAEALKRLLDEFKRQDEIVRGMLTPNPGGRDGIYRSTVALVA
jgi:hypothetical protein